MFGTSCISTSMHGFDRMTDGCPKHLFNPMEQDIFRSICHSHTVEDITQHDARSY